MSPLRILAIGSSQDPPYVDVEPDEHEENLESLDNYDDYDDEDSESVHVDEEEENIVDKFGFTSKRFILMNIP